jgi:hypothetical protein
MGHPSHPEYEVDWVVVAEGEGAVGVSNDADHVAVEAGRCWLIDLQFPAQENARGRGLS